MIVQVSINGGVTWVSNSMWIYAPPGYNVPLAVRTLLTVTCGETEAWSFGLKYDPNFTYYGGTVTINSVTTAGTHTATVQGGSAPDFAETEVRSGFYGYTQGVVIDTEQGIELQPTEKFVTSGACFTFRMPTSQGQYSVPLTFSDDLGAPRIWTVISQDGERIVPCAQNFTLNFYVSATYTPTSCNSGGPWIVAGDGQPATCNQGGGSGGEESCPERDIVFPPASLGDTNDDGRIDITDAVRALNFLFLQGPEPPQIDPAILATTGVALLKTGQELCYDNQQVSAGCPAPFFPLQDGELQKGFDRAYRLENPDCDATSSVVVDLRTGIMWQRNLGNAGAPQFSGTFDQAQMQLTNLSLEGFSDWRLPTVGELLSILHLEMNDGNVPNVDAIFQYGGGMLGRNWTKTPYRQMANSVWTVEVKATQLDTSLKTATAGLIPVRDAKAGNNEVLHAGPLAPAGAGLLRLGDANAHIPGEVGLNIADALFILNFLFENGPPPCVVPGPIIPVVGESVAPGRFLDNGNGTVTDNFTKLVWKKEPINFNSGVGLFNWGDGLTGACELDFPPGGLAEDWRIPNAFELMTIVDFAKQNGHVLAAPFTFFDDCTGGEPGCNTPLWTSTSFHRGPTQAFHLVPNGVLMMDTLAGALRPATALFASKNASLWVLPVRD
jgi:hypothetical protein